MTRKERKRKRKKNTPKSQRKNFDLLTIDKHHRKPRSLGGGDNPDNISKISILRHRAWHTLFDNCEPEEIARIINSIYLDPEWELIARKRS